ncbi:hypothetical protein [Marinobacterium stanieri]|uniref:hypothetical protein n=1 Tax=Marinobacterium stanieri TaxID=49186 RepID=UPI003A92B630
MNEQRARQQGESLLLAHIPDSKVETVELKSRHPWAYNIQPGIQLYSSAEGPGKPTDVARLSGN